MSSEPVIALRNVSKIYRAYKHPLHKLIAKISSERIRQHKDFHALNNVSLDIYKGETVGIIGKNGSGKSTLLQIICGIRFPSSGSVSVKGRVSALLELGSGFHPEFTGRENVFLQGAIIGLTREEMEMRFEDIAAFADIGEYIDQPVKTYSNGMFVRLAFAVAIHVTSDILVVDEALAVGDEGFQSKCFAKLTELRKEGVAILLVSHSTQLIIQLCDRAVLLEHGSLVESGEPKAVSHHYHARLRNTKPSELNIAYESRTNANQTALYTPNSFDSSLESFSTISYEVAGANIFNPRLVTLDGEKVNLLTSGSEYYYEYDVLFLESAEGVRFGMMIKTQTGYELGGMVSHAVGYGVSMVSGTTHTQRFRFRCSLLSGTYFLNAGVTARADNDQERYLHRLLDAVMFKVLPPSGGKSSGIIDFSTND